jgi:hypothetical protein
MAAKYIDTLSRAITVHGTRRGLTRGLLGVVFGVSAWPKSSSAKDLLQFCGNYCASICPGSIFDRCVDVCVSCGVNKNPKKIGKAGHKRCVLNNISC